MRKIFTLSLSLLVALFVLTGCTQPPADNTTPNQSTNNEAFKPNTDITVVSREDGSGTRGAFIELMGIEEKDANGNKTDRTTDEAVISNSTSVVMTIVSGNPYAIGYISLGSLNDTVKAVKVDDVEVTVENIKNGTYKVARPFNIAPKKDVSELTQDFINYIISKDGQKIVEDSGYISVAGDKEYSSSNLSGKIVVAGSSSVTPVMEKLKEGYEAINQNAKIEIQMNDSSTGMSYAINGTCDIGMASRALKDSEIEKGLTPVVIAMDGIAVITNHTNTVENLSAEQIKTIFTGELLKWNEIIQ